MNVKFKKTFESDTKFINLEVSKIGIGKLIGDICLIRIISHEELSLNFFPKKITENSVYFDLDGKAQKNEIHINSIWPGNIAIQVLVISDYLKSKVGQFEFEEGKYYQISGEWVKSMCPSIIKTENGEDICAFSVPITPGGSEIIPIQDLDVDEAGINNMQDTGLEQDLDVDVEQDNTSNATIVKLGTNCKDIDHTITP